MQGRGPASTRIPQPTLASLRGSRRDPTHQAFVDATYQENINNPVHHRQRRSGNMSAPASSTIPIPEGTPIEHIQEGTEGPDPTRMSAIELRAFIDQQITEGIAGAQEAQPSSRRASVAHSMDDRQPQPRIVEVSTRTTTLPPLLKTTTMSTRS